VRPAPPRPALFDQPATPTKPAATDEELAAFFADNAPETFAPALSVMPQGKRVRDQAGEVLGSTLRPRSRIRGAREGIA
jgi:hypothetical protein